MPRDLLNMKVEDRQPRDLLATREQPRDLLATEFKPTPSIMPDVDTTPMRGVDRGVEDIGIQKIKTPSMLKDFITTSPTQGVKDVERFEEDIKGFIPREAAQEDVARISSIYKKYTQPALNWTFRTWLPSKLAGYNLSDEEKLETIETTEGSWDKNLDEALTLSHKQNKGFQEVLHLDRKNREMNRRALEFGMTGFDAYETPTQAFKRGFVSGTGGEILERGTDVKTWLTWYVLQEAVPPLLKKAVDKLPKSWQKFLTKDIFNRANKELNNAYKTIGGSKGESLEILSSKYKRLASKAHPDKPTGSREAFERVKNAWDLIKKSRLVSVPDFVKDFETKAKLLYAGYPIKYKEIIREIMKIDPTKTAASLSALPITKLQGMLSELKVQPTPIARVKDIAKVEPSLAVEAKKYKSAEEFIESKDLQKAQALTVAKEKLFISEKGKMKPQYRRLAEAMTGKKSIRDMTQVEADNFIKALQKLPEPTYKSGKLVPPSIPTTKDIVTEGFFEHTFKKPTPAKLLTSQSRYAELLGVKELAKPFEVGKMNLDLEYGKISHQIDIATRKLKQSNVKPEQMAQLLNTNEEAPAELTGKERDIFNYFRELTREIISRENAVRKALNLEPIKYRKAYFKHVADLMSQEVVEGKHPLPEGLKYWSEQLVGKKVFNPMEMKRKLQDDLLDYFSKDLSYVMKSMAWTGLKEIYLAQPKHFFNKILGTLSKDKSVYSNLTPREQKIYDAQMTMPASTKKWLIDYVNIVLSGRQTSLDESVNLWITDTPIKDVVNKILKPFGKHMSQRPVTNMITGFSRLPIYGVLGGINPRQLLRNKMQTLQNMALYGVKNTLLGYIPTSSYPTLKKLKTDSLFKKSYSGFEDMPAKLRSKLERVGLAPYQWTALSNVSQAMNTSYHWTANKIQNPKFKKHGWADSKRTYKEDKDFFYPSEEEKLLKEMEYGAHTTQYGYIGMNMPEAFRYKSLAGITRLQSWWMNHWFVFHREAATRAFTGHAGYDPKLKITLGDRTNYLKYLIIGGVILNTLGYGRSYLIGTAPTGLPPTAQLVLGVYTLLTNLGDTPWEKRKRTQAVYQIKNASKTFIPGYLSIKDTTALLSGDKHWTKYLFYKKEAKKAKTTTPTRIERPARQERIERIQRIGR